jgi:hypothetical protein
MVLGLRGAAVTVVLGEIGWAGAADWVNPGVAEHRQLHGLAKALSVVADVGENYDRAAEDHRSHGDIQQETEGGEKHQQPHGRPQSQVLACLAWWLGVLELAHPGGVMLLELAL